eukprot:CAMPEP_0115018946 /NCGR_PEP_ID=MMETSP0216-20121206/29136_1 /TAXON_ID=223996 /ORGANISM="Protocruzia adherens, Strain Boccale" /LENGTH=225 /DNA_ID=CAMNT_0002390293 /DNA_START=252 /DNA_END=926 /DNA_ORIENTATION=-
MTVHQTDIVNENGHIRNLYLRSWRFGSNLADLIGSLKMEFGQQCPVLSQDGVSFGISSLSQGFKGLFKDGETKRKELAADLRPAVTKIHEEEVSKIKGKIAKLSQERKMMQENDEKIRDELKKVHEETLTVNNQALAIKKNDSIVDGWLNVNAHLTDMTLDEITEPADVVSRQILNLSAENEAMEDAEDFLEYLLRKKKIDLEKSLRLVRNLAEKRFYNDMLLSK